MEKKVSKQGTYTVVLFLGLWALTSVTVLLRAMNYV